MNAFAIAAVFKWLIDTLYKVIIMQCILSSSHPKQIKLMINYYVYNIREIVADAAMSFSCRVSIPLCCMTLRYLYEAFSWCTAPLVF